ncbi:hypothetical protein Ahy_A01g004033 isoform D [Arachis hypogaea]|uniref:Uncharacterized protein n=1 Tax=Arachis hypogaea TaxID=3818 RepID=A0A445EV63_ARAHY|nr:hypothetical protein Ahy_A01g004033 isoform D [Arachis hypogaea]
MQDSNLFLCCFRSSTSFLEARFP